MSNGNSLVVRVSPPNPFEPVRDAFRFEIPSTALERLCDLAKIPAHYRPTFANSLRELFAKSRRWHRLASRAVEMDRAAKELSRVAKDARKLKNDIDKLSRQARVTLGLYALRLEKYGEAESHEDMRNQIEEILQSGSFEVAAPKVDYLSWAVARIGSAAATESWPKPDKGNNTPGWKSSNGRANPHADTFNRFVTELGNAVRSCNSPLLFRPDDINANLVAFLEAASPYLPDGFVPDEVFHPAEESKRADGFRLKKLRLFGHKYLRIARRRVE